jgi:hypothetical protein
MKLKFRYSICCVVLLFSSITAGYAQRGYTMNFLDLVPQQNKYNPAYYTQYERYVGFPMLSNFQFQGYNDVFSISRGFVQGRDSNGFFKEIVPNNIIAGLASENNLGFDFGMDIFSLGFKIREKNQIHVSLGVEAQFNAMLTKNTVSFLLRGPGTFIGREDAISGNDLHVNIFGALSLGYSREINEKLSVGGRVRFLTGFANLHTERSNIKLHIDDGYDPDITPYTWTVTPDFALKGSFANDKPLLDLMRNPGEMAALPSFENMFKNLGIGIDLGAVYELSENLTVAASVYDMGFINWKSGVQRITSEKSEEQFVFSGVDFGDFFGDGTFDFEKLFANLIDSAKTFLQLNEEDTLFKSYRTPLRTAYNLSAFYNLTEKDQIGLMWNSRIGQHARNDVLTIAYTRKLGRNFQVCVNNAIINENPFNFGGGFAFNAGNLQFYFILDKINSFRVVDMRLLSMNLQFGLNFVMNRLEKDPNKRQITRDFTPTDRTGYVKDRWFW